MAQTETMLFVYPTSVEPYPGRPPMLRPLNWSARNLSDAAF